MNKLEEFWKSVYIAAISHGEGNSEATRKANNAVSDLETAMLAKTFEEW